MSVIKGDLLTVKGIKYITLGVLSYEGSDYAFVNRITENEDITDEYYIFKVLGDSVEVIIDDNLRNVLIPKFEELLKKEIQDIINE